MAPEKEIQEVTTRHWHSCGCFVITERCFHLFFVILQKKKNKKSVFLGEGNILLACTSVSLAATFSSAVPDGHFPRANGETLSKKPSLFLIWLVELTDRATWRNLTRLVFFLTTSNQLLFVYRLSCQLLELSTLSH